MVANSRQRILGAGAELFRRQGYTGTGVKQIVTRANAPFASLYHFFPGGKEELGDEVIRTSGAVYLELIDAFFGTPEQPVPDLIAATRAFFDAAAETLAETDFTDACPIATVALEVASTNERLRVATAEVFESWLTATAERLAAAGMPVAHTRETAITLFNLLEGAFILARATRSAEPLRASGAAGVTAVRAALEAA